MIVTVNKDTKKIKIRPNEMVHDCKVGRLSTNTIVLPDSGSMTTANICGTLKYNILKERDCV